MLTLTVSRKAMVNLNLKTQAKIPNLKDIRKKSPRNIVIGQRNINSLKMNLICLLSKSKGSSMCQLFQELNSMSSHLLKFILFILQQIKLLFFFRSSDSAFVLVFVFCLLHIKLNNFVDSDIFVTNVSQFLQIFSCFKFSYY